MRLVSTILAASTSHHSGHNNLTIVSASRLDLVQQELATVILPDGGASAGRE